MENYRQHVETAWSWPARTLVWLYEAVCPRGMWTMSWALSSVSYFRWDIEVTPWSHAEWPLALEPLLPLFSFLKRTVRLHCRDLFLIFPRKRSLYIWFVSRITTKVVMREHRWIRRIFHVYPASSNYIERIHSSICVIAFHKSDNLYPPISLKQETNRCVSFSWNTSLRTGNWSFSDRFSCRSGSAIIISFRFQFGSVQNSTANWFSV